MKSASPRDLRSWNYPWERIFAVRDEINGEESSLGENFYR